MYGNRTKQAILNLLLKEQIKQQAGSQEPAMPVTVRFTIICKTVKTVDEKKVAAYLLDMHLSGYLTFYNTEDHDFEVQINNEGIKAFTGSYFQIKQDTIIWKGVINTLMTGATLAIAISTIIALNNDGKEREQLLERLQKIETQQGKSRVIANPMPVTQKNAYRPSAKDSLKN